MARRRKTFLGRLSLDARQELERRAVERSFPPGTVLFRQGDRSDHVLCIVRGRVKVAMLQPRSGERVIAELGEGDIIGELSALDGRPRSADAVTLEEVTALHFPTDEFRQLLVGEPDVAIALLQDLADRIRASLDEGRIFGPSA